MVAIALGKYILYLTDLRCIWLCSIYDFRGACAVKGNIQVAGHVKRVDHEDAFNA